MQPWPAICLANRATGPVTRGYKSECFLQEVACVCRNTIKKQLKNTNIPKNSSRSSRLRQNRTRIVTKKSVEKYLPTLINFTKQNNSRESPISSISKTPCHMSKELPTLEDSSGSTDGRERSLSLISSGHSICRMNSHSLIPPSHRLSQQHLYESRGSTCW